MAGQYQGAISTDRCNAGAGADRRGRSIAGTAAELGQDNRPRPRKARKIGTSARSAKSPEKGWPKTSFLIETGAPVGGPPVADAAFRRAVAAERRGFTPRRRLRRRPSVHE